MKERCRQPYKKNYTENKRRFAAATYSLSQGGITMLLENKRVLITGAGRGIGRQTAIEMAEGSAKAAGADATLAVTGIAGPGG